MAERPSFSYANYVRDWDARQKAQFEAVEPEYFGSEDLLRETDSGLASRPNRAESPAEDEYGRPYGSTGGSSTGGLMFANIRPGFRAQVVNYQKDDGSWVWAYLDLRGNLHDLSKEESGVLDGEAGRYGAGLSSDQNLSERDMKDGFGASSVEREVETLKQLESAKREIDRIDKQTKESASKIDDATNGGATDENKKPASTTVADSNSEEERKYLEATLAELRSQRDDLGVEQNEPDEREIRVDLGDGSFVTGTKEDIINVLGSKGADSTIAVEEKYTVEVSNPDYDSYDGESAANPMTILEVRTRTVSKANGDLSKDERERLEDALGDDPADADSGVLNQQDEASLESDIDAADAVLTDMKKIAKYISPKKVSSI